MNLLHRSLAFFCISATCYSVYGVGRNSTSNVGRHFTPNVDKNSTSVDVLQKRIDNYKKISDNYRKKDGAISNQMDRLINQAQLLIDKYQDSMKTIDVLNDLNTARANLPFAIKYIHDNYINPETNVNLASFRQIKSIVSDVDALSVEVNARTKIDDYKIDITQVSGAQHLETNKFFKLEQLLVHGNLVIKEGTRVAPIQIANTDTIHMIYTKLSNKCKQFFGNTVDVQLLEDGHLWYLQIIGKDAIISLDTNKSDTSVIDALNIIEILAATGSQVVYDGNIYNYSNNLIEDLIPNMKLYLKQTADNVIVNVVLDKEVIALHTKNFIENMRVVFEKLNEIKNTIKNYYNFVNIEKNIKRNPIWRSINYNWQSDFVFLTDIVDIWQKNNMYLCGRWDSSSPFLLKERFYSGDSNTDYDIYMRLNTDVTVVIVGDFIDSSTLLAGPSVFSLSIMPDLTTPLLSVNIDNNDSLNDIVTKLNNTNLVHAWLIVDDTQSSLNIEYNGASSIFMISNTTTQALATTLLVIDPVNVTTNRGVYVSTKHKTTAIRPISIQLGHCIIGYSMLSYEVNGNGTLDITKQDVTTPINIIATDDMNAVVNKINTNMANQGCYAYIDHVVVVDSHCYRINVVSYNYGISISSNNANHQLESLGLIKTTEDMKYTFDIHESSIHVEYDNTLFDAYILPEQGPGTHDIIIKASTGILEYISQNFQNNIQISEDDKAKNIREIQNVLGKLDDITKRCDALHLKQDYSKVIDRFLWKN